VAIKLTELRKRVQDEFKTINNTPIEDCWVFDNEDGEKAFVSNGKKVEKTLIYLNKVSKKLYVIMIELKSTLKFETLIHCKEKFTDTLSHVSVYLLLNHHDETYDDYKVVPVGVVCFNREDILNSSRSYTQEVNLINNYKYYVEHYEDNFLVELNTLALGREMIATVAMQNSMANNHFSIDFIDDIVGKV